MNEEFRRILVVRTDRIGDVLLTLPMVEVLRRELPGAHIAMMIRRYTAELVEENPAVDQVLFYDGDGRPLPFFRLVASLREQSFDVVFHTHPIFRLALITRFARIPVRVGTGYRWYSRLFNRRVHEHRKDALRHELEYNLNLLKAIGLDGEARDVRPRIDVPPERLEKVRSLLGTLGVGGKERFVILHPGSGRSARDWNPENFGRLGRRIRETSGTRVLVTGGRGEEALVARVAGAVGGNVVPIVDRLSLREYAALAQLSSLFVANSTGPLHIAAAVGTPVIGLYPQVTPLSAARWGPFTEEKVIFTPKNKPSDCRRCLRGRSKTCECMETITVDEVYDAAADILQRHKR